MDLPPDKAKLLKQYDNEKKWDIICDQVSNNDESVYDSINRALIYWIFRYIVVERKKYFLSTFTFYAEYIRQADRIFELSFTINAVGETDITLAAAAAFIRNDVINL